MRARSRLLAMLAIALFLAPSAFGGPGRWAFVLDTGQARAVVKTVLPASASSAPSVPPAAGGSHDPNYYAYATRYYLQYLGSREQASTNAKDPYHFFNYYQSYQERYAPASSVRGQQGLVPAWFATMPFRNARAQAFARFVRIASPSASPDGLWVQPLGESPRTAER